MTLFRLALRLGRVGAIGAGFIGVAAAFAQPLAFAQLAGQTPQERAIFAQQMAILGRQLTYILPVPGDLGTMAGWVEWRAFGVTPPILAFWALMAASGAGRGDEEGGSSNTGCRPASRVARTSPRGSPRSSPSPRW